MTQFPRYDSSSRLHHLQRQATRSVADKRVPLVYGNNVFVTEPELLSHRISVDNGRLKHDAIALVSYGRDVGDYAGEVKKVDPLLYTQGIKLNSAIVVSQKDGNNSSGYAAHPKVYRSFPIASTSLTIPSKLPDGTTVTSGTVLYRQGTTWASQTANAGQTVTTPSPASWISLETTVDTIFPTFATANTNVLTDNETYTHPDLYVIEGKTVERLVGAGRGAYEPDSSHVIPNVPSYLVDVRSGQRFSLPLTTTPQFNSDSDWLVVRVGNSDRFPDIINNLLTTSSGGYAANAESLIDYQSFVRSNAHVDGLGLKFSGVIDSATSVNDFILDNALFFDLISFRDRNRLGMLPHTTEAYIKGIFTPFNCSHIQWEFLPISEHRFSDAYAVLAHDKSVVRVVSDDKTIKKSNPLVLDSSAATSNTVNLKDQLNRILKSANQQDEAIMVFTSTPINNLKAGDFILANSQRFELRRKFIGGMARSNNTDLFECKFDETNITFVLMDGMTNGIIQIDGRNSYDSYKRIEIVAGDIIVFRIRSQPDSGRISQNKMYARVKAVSENQQFIELNVEQIEWKPDVKDWVVIGSTVSVPKETVATLYRVGNIKNVANFYDQDGIPRQAPSTLKLIPSFERDEELMLVIDLGDYGGTVRNPTPLILDDDPKVWRISSIEPINHELGRGVVGQFVSRRNDGYRIEATLYPFSDARTLPTQKKPAQVVTEKELPVVSRSSEAAKKYLLDIAIGNEFSNQEGRVHKFRPGLIKVKINGVPKSADTATVQTVLDELQGLTGTTFDIVSSGAADVNIHFAPESSFASIEPRYVPVNFGFFASSFDANGLDIVSATVLINSNDLTQPERNHLIREELTQVLAGLPDDSFQYADSIFQQNWTSTQKFSDIDREIIKLMSHPSITSGMTLAQLKVAIANL